MLRHIDKCMARMSLMDSALLVRCLQIPKPLQPCTKGALCGTTCHARVRPMSVAYTPANLPRTRLNEINYLWQGRHWEVEWNIARSDAGFFFLFSLR